MNFKEFEHFGRDIRDAVLRLLRDYAEALVLALIMAFVLRLFVFSAYKISNVSMEPTLKLGDFVVGYKLPFGVSVPFSGIKIGVARPKRGDVVVFRCPDAPDAGCVKRVVAIAGDRIEIKKQRLVVNGHMAKYELSATETADFYSRSMKTVALTEKWRGQKRSVLISGADTKLDFGPYIVPPDSFFALADNRDMGLDSRHWGAIANRQIEARLLFIWLSVRWSQETGSGLKPSFRFNRIFKPVR